VLPELAAATGASPAAIGALVATFPLGMLLGFAERALGTFEDAIFGAGGKKPPTG
jgi:hypothetical protein